MSSLNPVDFESELYDSLLITFPGGGPRFSPGLVTLSGHDRGHKWDVKEASGSGGASTTYQGENVLKFTATFVLTIDDVQGIDDYAEWEIFRELLAQTLVTKPVAALPIYYPDLAAVGCSVVSVERIGGMTHNGDGSSTVSVSFVEFRPPKKKSSSPKPKGADQNAAAKAELDAAVNEAKKL